MAGAGSDHCRSISFSSFIPPVVLSFAKDCGRIRGIREKPCQRGAAISGDDLQEGTLQGIRIVKASGCLKRIGALVFGRKAWRFSSRKKFRQDGARGPN